MNYKENMQELFHALADMKLSKKDRATMARALLCGYVNGKAAALEGDMGHIDEVRFLCAEASK